MRVNKFIFPFILLIIFFAIILLGMFAGYWETKSGRGGGRGVDKQETLLPVIFPVETHFVTAAMAVETENYCG